jgi:hypothetical protein
MLPLSSRFHQQISSTSTSTSTTTTTISSLSLGSTSNSSSSSSLAACSSSLPRPRDLILLPNSSKSREWDVVELDPRSSSYHCSKLTSIHPPGNGRLATPKPKPKPKRPRSPPTRQAPPPKPLLQQQHKRQRPATEKVAEDELTNPFIAMDCFIFL